MCYRLVAYFLFISFFLSKAQALCVKVHQANLRAKPSAKGELLWTVGKYMPLYPLKEKGDWIYVKDLEGKKMWIHGGLVTDSIDCAVIRVKKTSLRKGPGTEFHRTALSYANRYAAFKKLEREGAWLHLKDDYGYDHWVYEKNLWEPLAYSQLTY